MNNSVSVAFIALPTDSAKRLYTFLKSFPFEDVEEFMGVLSNSPLTVQIGNALQEGNNAAAQLAACRSELEALKKDLEAVSNGEENNGEDA